MQAIFFILVSIQALASSTPCYLSLCQGDLVRDSYGQKGIIVGPSTTDGSVDVLLSKNLDREEFTYNDVGKSVMCYGEFCQGMHIVELNGDELMVKEVYTHRVIDALNLSTQARELYQFSEVELMK